MKWLNLVDNEVRSSPHTTHTRTHTDSRLVCVHDSPEWFPLKGSVPKPKRLDSGTQYTGIGDVSDSYCFLKTASNTSPIRLALFLFFRVYPYSCVSFFLLLYSNRRPFSLRRIQSFIRKWVCFLLNHLHSFIPSRINWREYTRKACPVFIIRVQLYNPGICSFSRL